MLIRDDILYRCTVEVIDSVVVDVMWVKMCSTQDEEARLLIAVCYSTFLQKLPVVVEMKRRDATLIRVSS